MTPINILLQTTIPYDADNWHIGRFSLLREHLAGLSDESGQSQCHVVARDREPDTDGNDRLLRTVDTSDFDEVWLLAADPGDGLGPEDRAALARFSERGGGLMVTRDHQDLGSSVCELGSVGAAHFFHSHHMDPDTSRHCIDDRSSEGISWPNYYSGRNGDYQEIAVCQPVHDLLKKPNGDVVRYFPAHPHEGAVGAPAGASAARVIATSTSGATGRSFNLVVAIERQAPVGRGVADSTFHHFADYNWDLSSGAPSFVTDPEGDGIALDPAKLDDVKAYVRNLVLWLAPLP